MIDPRQPLALHHVLWLLLSLALITAPHASRLPWWIVALVVTLGAWRAYIAYGRHALPNRWLLFLIVIGVYQATPRILDKVESGYQKNSEELQKAALVYQQANERLLQHMIDESKLRNDMLKSEIEDKDGI